MRVESREAPDYLSEEDKVIQGSRAEQQKLQSDIKKNNTHRMLHFYDNSDIPSDASSLVKRLKEKFKNDDSREWSLLTNPQIQKLLGNILSEHVKEWNKKRSERSEQEIKQQNEWNNENNEEETETWEDYKERESSPENFEEFLLSDEWIRILVDEIDKHLDNEWKIHKNYPISEKDLKLKLKRSRYTTMQREYNEKNGISDDENLQEIKQMGNIVADGIDTVVWIYLKSWWKAFDQWMVNWLENLLNSGKNREIINKIKEDSNLKDEFNRALKESIEKYSKYVLIGDNKVSLDTWSRQTDLQLKSYLYVYWKFFYPWLFKINQWSQYYEKTLPEVMACILANDDEKLKNIVKNNIFWEREQQNEINRKERDKKRRQEAAKRNRERNRNNGFERWKKFKHWENLRRNTNSWAYMVKQAWINLNEFKVNNWNMEAYANSSSAKQRAFWMAWKDFENSNKEIEDIITEEDMRRLFNTESNTINEEARNNFLESDIMQWRSQEEINKIYSIIKRFSDSFSNASKRIASWIQKQESIIDDVTRNFALWSVIDDVRSIFDNIVENWRWDSKFEWFIFDESEPVKREWDDIMIYGTFNWEAIKIRYDLLSWGLFMNSFLQHLPPSRIAIWNNTEPNLQIWQLDPFNKILDEHYRMPELWLNKWLQGQGNWKPDTQNQGVQSQRTWTEEWPNQWWNSWEGYDENNSRGWFTSEWRDFIKEEPVEDSIPTETTSSIPVNTSSQTQSFRPSASKGWKRNGAEFDGIRKKYRDMLNSNLDMISNNIVNNTKKQSAVNSVVTRFMKTFNIIKDGQENRSIEFNDWSNDLFDLLQIIENSNPAVLEQFQVLMEKVMEYSWLNRWVNNQKSQQSDDTFNERNPNKYTSMLKDSTNDFFANFEVLNGKMNFDSWFKFWFAQMIKENLTDGAKKPDWQLDAFRINELKNNLETSGKNS